MRHGNVPASDAVYRPLKSYVAANGGLRLAMRASLRDRLVEQIVEDWPTDCPPDRLEEVVRARVSVRLRQQYGGVVAMFLLSMIAQVVIKLVIEWWFSRQSHRVLMHGWSSAAQNPNV
jgi:hypothetical protein